MTTRVNIDAQAVAAINTDEPTRKEILRAGYQLAKRAATVEGPPRRSGRGANSIRGSVSTEVPGAADVSWGERYYYMIFHEDGWSPGPGRPRIPGRHFLRRAFEHYAHY